MTARRSLALALGLMAGATVAAARQAGTLDALFPWRAPVTLESDAGRLARLFLPADVLTAARPDLSDVRLLDDDGREIPFAVDRDAGLRRRVGALEAAPATIRSANQSRSQRDESTVEWSEVYELSAPPRAWREETAPARLFLRVVSDRSRFVKALAVSTLTGQPILADGSLFRLPAPLRESVRFELPRTSTTVRVAMEGEDGGWLEPTFTWELEIDLAELPEPQTVLLPLDETSRRTEDGETVIVLERPRGVLPLALELASTTPLFRRRVSVFDRGPGVPKRLLLEGEVRRVGTDEARLDLRWPAASRPLGGELEVRVNDRDSPPLDDLAISLRLARPAIVFAADARPARLVWGGARVRAPRYDVEALVPSLPASGDRAAIGRAVLEEEALIEAELGAVESNPGFDPVSPLDFAMAPGRELDARPFSHALALTAPDSTVGLYRLTLGAADQAVLRPDFGDLRIVDSQSRQRPYVLVPDSGRERIDVGLRSTHSDDATVLRLDLPSTPLTVVGITLEIEDGFFDRVYTVEGRVAGSTEDTVLSRGNLRRERSVDGTLESRSLELLLPTRRLTELRVRIADGSDRPLEITRAELEVPAPEVLFPARPGSYVALFGEPDLDPPRYELEAVRSLVQAIDSTPVSREALAPNDDFSLAFRMRRGSGLERTILGIALVAAVLVLTVVTLRLAAPRASAPGDGREERGVRNSAPGDARDEGGGDGSDGA